MKNLVTRGGLLGSLLILALLSACATAATQYAPLPPDLKAAPAPGKARICVIRGYILLLSTEGAHYLSENGTQRGDLVNASYICWERPPGKADLALYLGSWDNRAFQGNLVVEPGMVYYLYTDALNNTIESIPPAEGEKYLAEYPRPEVSSAAPLAFKREPGAPPVTANPAVTQPGAIQPVPRKEGAAY